MFVESYDNNDPHAEYNVAASKISFSTGFWGPQVIVQCITFMLQFC